MPRARFALFALGWITLGSSVLAVSPATPPEQPREGPGGSRSIITQVKSVKIGTGAQACTIFEPDAPRPDSAPVIIFLHGWSAMQPAPYQAWIDHLVKRGNIVLYPQYQEKMTSPPATFRADTIASVKAALAELKTGHHVHPQLNHLAAVGHSMGALLAVELAALASDSGLPPISALFSVMPGAGGYESDILTDLSKIPATTFFLVMVGDHDERVGQTDAKKLFYGTPQIPFHNKDFIILHSDNYGTPNLTADHYAPCASYADGTVNALDYYGTWKLLDGLTDTAFFGENRQFAFGDTQEQRFMGYWSDSQRVQELEIVPEP